MLFQRNSVGSSNQALRRQDAGSRAPGISFGADKFGNRLTIVLRHDPPSVVTAIGRAVIVELTARLCQSRSTGRPSCDGA
jgi:hypothetical protein